MSSYYGVTSQAKENHGNHLIREQQAYFEGRGRAQWA